MWFFAGFIVACMFGCSSPSKKQRTHYLSISDRVLCAFMKGREHAEAIKLAKTKQMTKGVSPQ